jgi:hypothetical protein
MKKNNLYISRGFLLVCCLLTLVACRSTRITQTKHANISGRDTIEAAPVLVDAAVASDSSGAIEAIMAKVKSSIIDFQTFTSKVKVDFSDDAGKSQNATAYIRIQKDSLIWISLTGALGVEGFRAEIHPDSVIIMDKLGKTVSYKSIASLQEITKLPVDFYALQDILVGNPVYFSDTIISYKADSKGFSATSKGATFNHQLRMDTLRNTILYSAIEDNDPESNRKIEIWFDGYVQNQNRSFSEQRAITVQEKNQLKILLDYKQVTFNETVSFPFNIPKSYKVK